MNKKYSFLSLAIAVAIAGCNSSSTGKSSPEVKIGRYMAGDIHMHSTMTDGDYTYYQVAQKAFEQFGLDFIANAGHGGWYWMLDEEGYRLDDNGNRIFLEDAPEIGEKPRHDYDYALEVARDSKTVARDIQMLDGGAYSIVKKVREMYADEGQFVINGLEWNVPGVNDHASIGVINEQDGEIIAEFHRNFDYSVTDHHGNIWKDPEYKWLAYAGVQFLENNYGQDAYFIINHPSRRINYKVEDYRSFHNASELVTLGFEGFPGHQKQNFRGGYDNNIHYQMIDGELVDNFDTGRGEVGGKYDFCETNLPEVNESLYYHAQTYGGADYALAKVGGLWDALLGEGREFWLFSNADFHHIRGDFWPGEYQKSHSWVEKESYEGIVAGMRSGNTFVTTGDLITDLDFTVSSGNKSAYMGETLVASTDTSSVSVKFQTGQKNHNDDIATLVQLDVIVGDVTGRVYPGNPTEFNNPNNASTYIAKSFTPESVEWVEGENGWVTVEFELDVEAHQYVRLRGSSNGANVPGYTDQYGNPLVDTLKARFNDGQCISEESGDLEQWNPEEPWNDLWFYSNPIFIKQA
ncbi:hypothetical protein RJ45_16405 [Photobacterium gaetbulicola]|uniref:Histidinol phosphatase n=1 Tax=Photobacterium gaetbulicola TaxID=1295392 RepID=A0A0B9GCS5_9GAMM|nr:hypothetical protein [Photobacterium gaetbulicola]KHT62675.1 hypothetical protein RJ45_16405 [Photobacterium gaetbulicola]